MSKHTFIDESHIMNKMTRIAFLELEIKKIKTGVTKAASDELLKDILTVYEKELAELKNSEQQH